MDTATRLTPVDGSRSRRSLLRRLAIASLLTVLAFLGSAEVLTSFDKAGNTIDFVRDDTLGIIRRPDIDGWSWMNGDWIRVRINALSMRDGPIPADRDPSEVRVLCIGDSFTYGGGVQQGDSYPAQMQALLGPPKESGVRVMNGGANGWHTKWQRLFLESKADALDPDIVVLGWNWNDLNNLHDGDLATLTLKGDGCWLCRSTANTEWIRGTHMYRFLNSRTHGAEVLPVRAQQERSFKKYTTFIDTLCLESDRMLAQRRERLYPGGAALDYTWWRETETPQWTEARKQIEAMNAYCTKRNATLVVALLAEPTWNGAGSFPATERMGACLDHQKIHWLEIQEEFLKEPVESGRARRGRNDDLWLQYDWVHPTPEGHRIFARRIVDFLSTEGLLTKR